MRQGPRPRFWILLIIAVIIIAIAVWYLRPLRHAGPAAYRPADASVLVYSAVDRKASGTMSILDEARLRLFGAEPSALDRFLFRTAVAVALPRRVAVWVVPGSSREELSYLAVVDFGRGGRLIRTFAQRAIRNRLFDDWSTGQISGARITVDWSSGNGLGPGGLAFTRDSLLVSNNHETLEAVLSHAERPEGRFRADIERATATTGGLHIVAENDSGSIRTLVAAAEEEFAFSIMPSADSLVSLNLDAALEDGAARGVATFVYDDPARVDVGYGDLRYAYGIIRRLLRPRGLDMGADITVHDLRIEFAFSIDDFLTILDSSQGET